MSSSGSGPSSPAGSAARGPDLERFVSWVREQAIAHPLRATVIATATGYVVGGGLPRRFTRVFLATAVRAAALSLVAGLRPGRQAEFEDD